MSEQQKILVIKLGALGDFVQALGPMKAIRNHHPDADITLLTTDPFISFGRECGYADHIWTDSRPRWLNISDWLELRKKLNNAKFDRVYDLQNNDRTSFYFKLFSVKPEWVGVAKGASHRNTSPERTAGHAYDGHVQTLMLAGINNIEIDDLSWIKGEAERFHTGDKYVLLVPGCSPGRPEKRWSAEEYGIIARTLYGWGYTPVIIGTKDEQPLAATIGQYCLHSLDLTGQTTLQDIILLGRNAAAAIGNDTGPMHLIAPTGCPSYVIFSANSNPVRHAPKGAKVKIIQQDNLADLTADNVIESLNIREFRENLPENKYHKA